MCNLLGLFDDRVDERSPRIVAGLPKLGKVAELIEFARQHARRSVDRVDAADAPRTRVLEMLKQLWVLPVDIRLSAHMSKLQLHPRAYSYRRRRAGVRHGRPADLRLELVFKWLFDNDRRARRRWSCCRR